MRFTTVTGEASVGALADRLYANLTPASRALAESALLKANPHLAGKAGLPPGAVVRVPEVAGLTIKPGAANRDPAGEALKDVTAALSDYHKRLVESVNATKKDFAAQGEVLKSKEAKSAISKAPDAAKLAASLTVSLAERAKALADVERRLPAVFAALTKDLDSLADRGD